jgi:predicted secreted protein
MRRIMTAVLLLPLLASAATKVTLNESVSITVEPDTMRTTLSFEERSRDDQAVRKHFNTLVKTVKQYNDKGGSLECRGGGYRISPQYSWKNSRQQFLGYRGNVSFTCSFREIGEFNALSADLDNRLTALPGVKRNQGQVQWFVSDERNLQNRERLESMLVRRIERKREHLSEIMQLRCATTAIAFSSRAPAYPVERMMVAKAAASVPVETPIQGDTTLTLRGAVEYRCE